MMKSISDVKFRRTTEALASVVDGELIVLNVATEDYYATGESGKLIWDRIVAGCSLQEIADILKTTYDLDESTAFSDARSFVRQLELAGLVAEVVEHRVSGS